MHTLVRTIKIFLITASFNIPAKGLFAQLHHDWIDISMSETIGNYMHGTPMFLETCDDGKVYLLYFDNEGAEQKILLR